MSRAARKNDEPPDRNVDITHFGNENCGGGPNSHHGGQEFLVPFADAILVSISLCIRVYLKLFLYTYIYTISFKTYTLPPAHLRWSLTAYLHPTRVRVNPDGRIRKSLCFKEVPRQYPFFLQSRKHYFNYPAFGKSHPSSKLLLNCY